MRLIFPQPLAFAGDEVTSLVQPGLYGKTYTYYRCTKNTKGDHPRVRLTEAELDGQAMTLLQKIRQPEAVQDWFLRTLLECSQHEQRGNRHRADELQRELSLLRRQQDELLNLKLLGEIELERYSAKNTQLRDRIATCTLPLESIDWGRDEHADLPRKVFELSQSLPERWLSADRDAKRRILKTICLNFRLDGATLVPQWRKPFDVLAEGLSVSLSRGDRI